MPTLLFFARRSRDFVSSQRSHTVNPRRRIILGLRSNTVRVIREIVYSWTRRGRKTADPSDGSIENFAGERFLDPLGDEGRIIIFKVSF